MVGRLGISPATKEHATVRGIDYLRFGPMASQCSTCVNSSCTFATATTEWHQLNRTVGTFNGVANPGTGTLVIEVQAFVPKTVAERVLS